jgi:hypothetical protein
MARHDGKSAEASLNGCAVRHAGGEAMMIGARVNRRNPAVRAALAGCLVALLAGCSTAATPLPTAERTTASSSSISPTSADGVPAVVSPSNTAEPSAIALPSAAATPADAAPALAAAPTPVDAVPAAPVRVLQLNLCSSGIAACYTGRSTAAAAAVIRAEIPDLVSLNEICQDDLPILQQALAEVSPDGGVVSAFQGARDRRTGDDYRCRNGQPYGIGLISRWPPVPGSAGGGGIYPSQDLDDPEERAWLCLGVAASPALTVCTTHLAYTKQEVAAAQCAYLFGTVIAHLRELDPVGPVVLGGDLNLGSGDSTAMRACLPAASAPVDDGGVQLVVATPEFVVGDSERIDLGGTTDHPGLLVTLSPA